MPDFEDRSLSPNATKELLEDLELAQAVDVVTLRDKTSTHSPRAPRLRKRRA